MNWRHVYRSLFPASYPAIERTVDQTSSVVPVVQTFLTMADEETQDYAKTTQESTDAAVPDPWCPKGSTNAPVQDLWCPKGSTNAPIQDLWCPKGSTNAPIQDLWCPPS